MHRKAAGHAGIDDVAVIGGGLLTIAGVDIVATELAHQHVYPGVPVPRNLDYRVSGQIFAPGDAFAITFDDIDVLPLLSGAPWMKLSTVDEAI